MMSLSDAGLKLIYFDTLDNPRTSIVQDQDRKGRVAGYERREVELGLGIESHAKPAHLMWPRLPQLRMCSAILRP